MGSVLNSMILGGYDPDDLNLGYGPPDDIDDSNENLYHLDIRTGSDCKTRIEDLPF